MLQSNQIINENALPPIKSEPLNVQGKVRILAFDVAFSHDTIANEEIFLVKLPKSNARVIQIGLTCAEGTTGDTFDLVCLDVVYNSLKNEYNITRSNNLKTGLSLTNSGGAIVALNHILSPAEMGVSRYIALKSSIPFSKANILNGYVLYVAD
ncbi:MAG: hypothetical protein LBQ34_07070 [Alphaproteobacteria bacterium]|jgi:hypothetical protein|nr:hypothetical protein [Alphaproteobacteria bacterium]